MIDMECESLERAARIPSMPKIGALTGLRGIAAIYVVIYHYFNLLSANAEPMFIYHGYLAVDLFFVLSGFVMAMSYGQMFASGTLSGSYLRFLGRRIARIYPLYLVGTLVGFVLAATNRLDYPQTVSLGVALGLNIAMVQVWGLVQSLDGPAWSISAEWAAYLLFPALLVPALFRKPIWSWLLASSCVGVLAMLCTFSASRGADPQAVTALLSFWNPWLALPVARCLPEFALGMLAFRAAATPLGQAMGSNAWICPATCAAILMLLAAPNSDLEVVLLFPLLILSLASGNNVIGRIFASPPAELGGVLSYAIYLIHFLLLTEIVNWERVLMHGARLAAPPLAICTAVGLGLTFGLAYVAFKTIELPARRRLRAAFERARPDRDLRAYGTANTGVRAIVSRPIAAIRRRWRAFGRAGQP